MNRKAETFFDAITLLREDLVEEAQNYVFRRKRSAWKTFGSLAACIALVASLGMLAILPRGCGAGGADSSSSGSMNNSSAPPASCDSPGAVPSDGTGTDTPYGNIGTGDSQSTEAGQILFTAQVLEVLDGELLVEPLDAFQADADTICVPLDGLEGLPEFYPGAVVQVRCGAVSGGTAEDVASVCFLEP